MDVSVCWVLLCVATEDETSQERTLKVYSIYSRKPLSTVYKLLKELQIEYYIFQQSSCVDTHPNPDCTYIAMWDLQDPDNRHRGPLCNKIMHAVTTRDQSLIAPMSIAYVSPSSTYVVLKL